MRYLIEPPSRSLQETRCSRTHAFCPQMWQIAFVVAVLASIFLLRLYAEKGTPVAIMIPVLISWSLGFFFFLVLPFDLEYALCRKCRENRPPEECACLAGAGGMGIEQLKDLIPAAYT